MNTGYKLYGRPGSGSLAVQIALEEIGAPYERIWVGSDADAVAQFLGLISQGLGPYVLGGSFSIADVYLYMLASWHPGDRSGLYGRLPQLEAHAKIVSARPAVAKVEADHAR